MTPDQEHRSVGMDEDFASLLEQSLGQGGRFEGGMVAGLIVGISGDAAFIDAGLKSEGRVPLREFGAEKASIRVGDTVDVVVERYEDRDGYAVLSRLRAKSELRWRELEKAFAERARVTGEIIGRTKGGYRVDLGGVTAFLPKSQLDTRATDDASDLMYSPQPFLIVGCDRRAANVVVSRRAVLEEARSEQRAALVQKLHEGAILQGVVKNIADFGAFVDLGGIDGLLHISDISWKRIAHPGEALSIGQHLRVVVTRYSAETGRINLGLKQLEADPWIGMAGRFPAGSRVSGQVTQVVEYGAFVSIAPGVEGLVHVSDMSWDAKVAVPGQIVSASETVEVQVLDIDETRRRLSLGLKQVRPRSPEEFLEQYPAGSEAVGMIGRGTPDGPMVGLGDGFEGVIADMGGQDAGTAGNRVTVRVLGPDGSGRTIRLALSGQAKAGAEPAAVAGGADAGDAGDGPSLGAILGAALRRRRNGF